MKAKTLENSFYGIIPKQSVDKFVVNSEEKIWLPKNQFHHQKINQKRLRLVS
jgi:hypothetical protein